jgi:hypothetical protein
MYLPPAGHCLLLHHLLIISCKLPPDPLPLPLRIPPPPQVRVVGVHLVQVEGKPYLALVQETASGGDLGWQVEDCDFHCGEGGTCSLVRRGRVKGPTGHLQPGEGSGGHLQPVVDA